MSGPLLWAAWNVEAQGAASWAVSGGASFYLPLNRNPGRRQELAAMLNQCEAATDMSGCTSLSTEPEEKESPRRKKGQPCEPTLRWGMVGPCPDHAELHPAAYRRVQIDGPRSSSESMYVGM